MKRNLFQKVIGKLLGWKERIGAWWIEYGKYRIQKLLHPKACFLLLTPVHGNLGDHAIAISEGRMLRGLGIRYIEVSGRALTKLANRNKLGLFNHRLIIINGGGNLGTLWIRVEYLMRKIIAQNLMATVAVFPNTIYYEDTAWGKEEFEKSKEIYCKKNVHLYAREYISQKIMKEAYGECTLMPDMVLRLNDFAKNNPNRSGCIVSLRKDCEKTRTQEQENVLLNKLQALFGDNMCFMDTVKEYSIPTKERQKELEKFLLEFGKAELIVTDRLHGMIFAAISGTPCIVIDSKSPKLRGCYEWIKNLDYIKFCDNIEFFEKIYEQLPKGSQKYNNGHLNPYYEQLERDILTFIGKNKKKCRK